VKGIARVDNQLVVDANVGTKGTVQETKAVAKEVGEKTKDGAVKVGEKTKEGVSKVGSEINDAWILGKVKAQFVGEDVMKGSDINVDCDKHIVRLRGTVPTAAAKARAMEIARKTDGVDHVIDELTIGPKK
jgi:osmotically-inducible protein OsmY